MSFFPPTSADDGPRGAIIDHFPVGLRGAGCGLELDDPILREAEVHPLCFLHEECHLHREEIVNMMQAHQKRHNNSPGLKTDILATKGKS